ncbi:hypothetical protein ACFWNK_22205 [Streptomyces sp. NPDC058417]|uniref:hypothetical protein n=1 Tax=unclassified Streptomyces TaxID=2593676 RepID=UPI003668BAFB
MTVDQLPVSVREFANYLDSLLGRLDQRAGWCAVFWQRDPDGMRACLDGREVPPWDVVEALLQDLAAAHGTPAAAQEARRARPLHIAALVAYDALPGARDALGDRLDAMLREQRQAFQRQADLGRLLAAATTREEAASLRLDLAWAQDDQERATARCAELRYRIAESERGARAERDAQAGPASGARPLRGFTGEPAPSHPAYEGRKGPARERERGAGPGRTAAPGQVRAAAPAATAAPGPLPDIAADTPAAGPAATVPKQRKRRRGGARFAGMVEEETAAVDVPPAASEETAGPAAPAVPAPRVPRGARFAGAAEEPESPPGPRPADVDPAARRETAEAVARLVRLRAEGRSGEAHVLLVELAHWPAERIPLLAADLPRAGLTADWTTLLWEAGSLPADRLVAAADALVAAGRAADGEQILRQGVARPAEEIGAAVAALLADRRHREAHALLDALVRVRTPEEAARSATPAPPTLVPLLLAAARAVSEERHWDLIHALRVAGLTA